MMRNCIGVDEAGRGPVIGPLIVCSISIPEGDMDQLEKIEVDDSKKLSKAKRLELFEKIVAIAEHRGWGIGTINCSPEEIDLNMAESNLNSLEVVLFSKAITQSSKTTSNNKILLDACDVDAKRFGRRVARELGASWESSEIFSQHKMDARNPLVAAASIVAKITRDCEMQKLSDDIGFDLGSGYPSDPKTKNAMKILCEGDLPADCLRWSWSTVSDTWSAMGKGESPIRSSDGKCFVQSSLID